MQADLFNQPSETGAQLRDRGIKQAEESAHRIHHEWNEKAFEAFKAFLKTRAFPWMCEDFRKWAEEYCNFPEPPSLRAYGGIIVRAKKLKMIHQVSFKAVTNPRAHKAICAVWEEIK